MIPVEPGLPSPNDLNGVSPQSAYVSPRGIIRGAAAEALIEAGQALPLCGANAAFTALELVTRTTDSIQRYASSVTAFNPWLRVIKPAIQDRITTTLDNLGSQRSSFAGMSLDRPRLMGIVNVTPDSFSDGGDHETSEAAIRHALSLADEGADILDVGGESTRPGADPVAPEEEQRRVLPVVRALAEKQMVVSVDTRHASTMDLAFDAGASIVNDVTALEGDAQSIKVVALRNAPVVLMHMQGEPRSMQSDPQYTWAPIDVFDALAARIKDCEEAGLERGLICVDPGIGFGKNDIHNLEILDALALFHGIGCPVLIGASRKSFIGRLTQTPEPKDRVPGSLAATQAGIERGVQIFRVHDVAETRQAITIAESIDQVPGHEPQIED